jgi:hypothetical protein
MATSLSDRFQDFLEPSLVQDAVLHLLHSKRLRKLDFSNDAVFKKALQKAIFWTIQKKHLLRGFEGRETRLIYNALCDHIDDLHISFNRIPGGGFIDALQWNLFLRILDLRIQLHEATKGLETDSEESEEGISGGFGPVRLVASAEPTLQAK